MNETTTAPTQFKGYQARLTNGDVVRVINRNPDATVKATGEKIVALKVRVRRISGYVGWSGGARPAYTYGPAFWVRASQVAR